MQGMEAVWPLPTPTPLSLRGCLLFSPVVEAALAAQNPLQAWRNESCVLLTETTLRGQPSGAAVAEGRYISRGHVLTGAAASKDRLKQRYKGGPHPVPGPEPLVTSARTSSMDCSLISSLPIPFPSLPRMLIPEAPPNTCPAGGCAASPTEPRAVSRLWQVLNKYYISPNLRHCR